MATSKGSEPGLFSRSRIQDFTIGFLVALIVTALVGLLAFSILRNLASQGGEYGGLVSVIYFAKYLLVGAIVVLGATFFFIAMLRPAVAAHLGGMAFFLICFSPIPVWTFKLANAAMSLASRAAAGH